MIVHGRVGCREFFVIALSCSTLKNIAVVLTRLRCSSSMSACCRGELHPSASIGERGSVITSFHGVDTEDGVRKEYTAASTEKVDFCRCSRDLWLLGYFFLLLLEE